MDLLLGWLRLPIVLCVAVLRLLSFCAGIATFGGLLMQRSESRFICFVVMPLTSFACYVLASKLSEQYQRAMARREAGSGAR